MRVLVIASLLCVLAACAATPSVTDLGQAPSRSRSIEMYGTLAAAGSFEWKAAPAYTRLALLRRTAAQRLNAGRIGVAHAREIQARADEARGFLDRAVAAHPRAVADAEQLLAAASHLILDAEDYMKGATR